MASPSTTLLFLNNAKYDLNTVKTLGKSGPIIAIDSQEINLFDCEDENTEHKVTFNKDVFDDGKSGVIFFKQHGKYTVLLGKAKVAEMISNGSKIKGKLLSTPGFKKAKIDDSPPQRAASNFSSEFANTPRFIDNRSKRHDPDCESDEEMARYNAGPIKVLKPAPKNVAFNSPEMDKWRLERNRFQENNQSY